MDHGCRDTMQQSAESKFAIIHTERIARWW